MNFNKLSAKNRRWLKLQIALLCILVIIYIALVILNAQLQHDQNARAESTPIPDGIHPPVEETIAVPAYLISDTEFLSTSIDG